jgi:hypothetical protein
MRLIDIEPILDAAKLAGKEYVSIDFLKGFEQVDAVPVVRGEWKHAGITNVYGGHQHKCSVCGYSLMVSPACDNENYCCNCGAKMDGEKEGV